MTDNKIISLYISSADRVSGTRDDFNVRLPSTVPNVHKIEVNEVILPLILYNITSGCNKFEFTDSASSSHTITISPGSYNADQLASLLEDSMNAVSADTYSISYSSIYFTFIITTTNGTWTLDDVDNNIYSKIGMTPGTSVLDGSDNSIISIPTAFGVPFHAYIESSALSPSNFKHTDNYMSSNRKENGRNIIAKVPLTDNTGGVVFTFYQNKETSTSLISDTSTHTLSQIIDVRLKFPDEQPMQIMSDWSMVIHIHYK